MFCPKCGSKNAEDAKFCRACGADVSNVLAVVEGGQMRAPALAEKQLNYFAAGLGSTIIGSGMVVAAILAVAFSPRLAILTIFALAFASIFLGLGISLMVKARGVKKLRELKPAESAAALPAGEPDYIKPSHSIYETDELSATPVSVTEHTTTHLKHRD